jgi:hypothetical protein
MPGFLALLPALLGAGGSIAGALVGNRRTRTPQAAQLSAIVPQLEALMRAQQQQALYTDPSLAALFGRQAPPGSVPLQLALARLAYQLLPRSARAGLSETPLTGGPGQRIQGGRPIADLLEFGRRGPGGV